MLQWLWIKLWKGTMCFHALFVPVPSYSPVSCQCHEASLIKDVRNEGEGIFSGEFTLMWLFREEERRGEKRTNEERRWRNVEKVEKREMVDGEKRKKTAVQAGEVGTRIVSMTSNDLFDQNSYRHCLEEKTLGNNAIQQRQGIYSGKEEIWWSEGSVCTK